MIPFIGELAALSAALGFSVTSVCYTFAGRKLNAVTAIAMSLPISWLIIVVIHFVTLGEFFPFSATLDRWFYLSTSGILAFVISSYFVLNAFQYIGPRLTMLIASFAPVLGAVFAWIFLGQILPAHSILGIAVVMFGIVWVVAERGTGKLDDLNLDIRRGVIYATLGMIAQAASFVFASQGIYDEFPAFSAALIRISAGIVALWIWLLIQRKLLVTLSIFRNDTRLFWQLSLAAISGPVISGSLILVSFQLIPVGISTTLSHTTSIILIPIGYFLFKERITPRAIIGTIITVVGIAILFF